MKNKIKLRFLVISFSLFFLLFIFDSYNLRDINPRENNPIDNINPIERDIVPIQSDSWIVSPISIDDLNVGINDWATINATYAWCNGAGTFRNPFIIENVTIDAGGVGSGILIANSSVYFIIRNCTLHNSGTTEFLNAGIKLYNTDNGQLINNTCSNTNLIGILLLNGCDNNTIDGNTATNNSKFGLRLENNCKFNTISGNNFSASIDYDSILLYIGCNNNTIINNFLDYSGRDGIRIEIECNNNNITGNIINSCYHGIYLNNCSYNYITGNILINCPLGGISLHFESTYNKILENVLNDIGYTSIFTGDLCDHNDIIENNINNAGNAVFLCSSYNNIIENNINKTGVGISSGMYWLSEYNNIIDNNIFNSTNYAMLFLNYGNHLVKGNYLCSGLEGISIYDSPDNTIYQNIFKDFSGDNAIISAGGGSFWDNGTVGNYWDDYVGADINEDGIGDSVYTNTGSPVPFTDHKPIYNIPKPPVNMDLNQHYGYIHLTWDEPIHYIPITYNIYRGESEGGSKTYIGSSSTTEFNDIPPFNKTMYYYIVRTVNIVGDESDNSTEVSGMAFDEPFIRWKSPSEEELVVLPVGDAVFNFELEWGELDNITLEINGKHFGSIWNMSSTILSPYTVDIDGRVNATVFGYQTGIPTPVVNDTRTFIFTKLTSEVYELLEEDTKYLGQQLYMILHDPCGDSSFSSFTETSTISIGVGGEITAGVTGGLEFGGGFSLFGISVGSSYKLELKTSTEIGYGYRYEITDITSLTSSQDIYDEDYIGPGYGDRYWGEAWTLKWELKAYYRTYFNGSEVYEEPKIAYGIIRGGEVLLNDYNAPQAWRDLNPIHNGWQNVNWIDNLTIVGGSPYTKTNEVTTTQTQSKSFEIGISIESRNKLSFSGFFIESSIGISVNTKVYREQEETHAHEVSLTIYDDESTDTIVQEYGIDTLFGTYIFRTNEFMCETSYPLEHNTTDYIPPIIDFPIVVLDSSQDGLYPCKDDSPIITIEIFDEGGIQQALLWFSINDGANWDSTILSEQPANPGTWQTSIPAHDHGTTVLWYIQVWDLQGLNSTRKDPNENLYRFIVINRAPTLSLISPNGGDAFKDSVLIEWSASDLDGDGLTFTLAYGDGSGGWYFIEDGITGTSYEWDITNIPYSDSILIKIIAYDGFGGQAEDQSDFLFTIGEAPLFELNEVIIPVTLITMIGGLVGLAFLIFRSNQSLKEKLDVMEKRIKSYETRIKPKGKSIQEKIQEESLDLKDRTNLREKK